MVYIEGGDHLPLKSLPSRQLIGPRPPVPPMPTANFFTLGRMMTQSAFATTLAGTPSPPSMACNTVAALRMVSSSLFLSAPQAGKVKTRSRDVRKQDITLLVCCIGIQPPFFLQSVTGCQQTQKHCSSPETNCRPICSGVKLCSPIELSGSNSVVESRLPKPLVAGWIPVSRSKNHFQFSDAGPQIPSAEDRKRRRGGQCGKVVTSAEHSASRLIPYIVLQMPR